MLLWSDGLVPEGDEDPAGGGTEGFAGESFAGSWAAANVKADTTARAMKARPDTARVARGPPRLERLAGSTKDPIDACLSFGAFPARNYLTLNGRQARLALRIPPRPRPPGRTGSGRAATRLVCRIGLV